MISIQCPDCSTEVSSSERTCPSCNFPISKLRGLSSAILTKNAERVAGLIQLGADVNAIDKNGRTPLMIAALIDSDEIVQMLMAVGARPEFVNEVGETALSLAKSKEVEKILRRALVVSRFNSLQKSESKTVAPPIQRAEPVTSKEVALPKTEPEPKKNEPHIEAAAAISPEIDLEQTQPLLHEIVEEQEVQPNLEEVVEPPKANFENLQVAETDHESAQVVPSMHEEPPSKEEPALQFDDSFMFTEVWAWENRIKDFPAVKSNGEQSAFEFSQQELHTQDEVDNVPRLNEPAPLDFQLKEETFGSTHESAQEVQPMHEEPALDFHQSLIFTEVSAWENRIEDFPSVESNGNQSALEFPHQEQQTQAEVVAHDAGEVTEEELFDFPILPEPFVGFSADEFDGQEIASLTAEDHEDHNIPDDIFEIPQFNEAAPIDLLELNEETFESIPSDAYSPEAAQLNSPKDWIEVQQPSQDFMDQVFGRAEESQNLELSQMDSPEQIPDVICLECGEVIGLNDLRCSKCHTTIVRRYCSGCSESIPDHSLFCPYCRTYVAEHFHYAKNSSQRYVLGATIGLCLLILLMVLTWPRSSKSPAPQATRSPKPVNQITKTQPPKSSEIIFIPPETKDESKPEKITQPEKQEPVQQHKLEVREETKPVDPTPQPQVKNTMVASSSKQKSKPVTERASTVGDQEKIRLGRALNSRGYSLIKQGRPSEAIPLLEQSLRSFPNGTKDVHYAYALFNLGVAWRRAGRPDVAIPILEKRIRINNQRDVVARELNTARQQAKDAGLGNFQK